MTDKRVLRSLQAGEKDLRTIAATPHPNGNPHALLILPSDLHLSCTFCNPRYIFGHRTPIGLRTMSLAGCH
jgi:hypothetical protein